MSTRDRSPDPNVVNFIWCDRRRGTLPPAVIRAPDCKTTKTTIAADKTTTREAARVPSADHQTEISSDLEIYEMTKPPALQRHRLEQP
jgi:hypothetical protein